MLIRLMVSFCFQSKCITKISFEASGGNFIFIRLISTSTYINNNIKEWKKRLKRCFLWTDAGWRAYLQELSELCVAEVLVSLVAEVQPDELTVPVEGNVMVNCGLAEDVTDILWKSETCLSEKKETDRQKMHLSHPARSLLPFAGNLADTEERERVHLDDAAE